MSMPVVKAPKYAVAFSNEFTVFTDNKGKVEKFDNLHAVSESDAITSLKREGEARINATAGALSIIVNMFDSPRLDSYRGKTPANEKLPKEAKDARREMEGEYLKPLFIASIKGNSPEATKHAQWDKFIGLHRAGGVWSLMNSIALQYWCIVGQLPCVYVAGKPQKDQLLSKQAMEKIIANLRAAEDTTDRGIAGKLADLNDELEHRSDKTHLGNAGLAVAALKNMLATYEGLLREESEAAMIKHSLTVTGDLSKQADAVSSKAKGKGKNKPKAEAFAALNVDTDESLTTAWNAGELTDEAYVFRMAEIGIAVEVATE